jgi:hypothetical protein
MVGVELGIIGLTLIAVCVSIVVIVWLAIEDRR